MKMINVDTAVILAAGKGSRLKSDNIKPLVTVNNKPLICNVIDNLLAAGIHNIYVIKRKADNLDIIQNRYRKRKIEIKFLNDSLGLGSLYTFSLISNIEAEWFVCTDCDVICSKTDFTKMLNQGRKLINMTDLMGVVAEVKYPSRNDKDMLLVKDGYAKRFVKQGVANGKRGGFVYLFSKSVLNTCNKLLDAKCFSLASFLDMVMKNYKIGVMQINDLWDIDTIEDIEACDDGF